MGGVFLGLILCLFCSIVRFVRVLMCPNGSKIDVFMREMREMREMVLRESFEGECEGEGVGR